MIRKNFFVLLRNSEYSKKGVFTISTSLLFIGLTLTETALSEVVDYSKLWSVGAESLLLGIFGYILSPVFKALLSNHADDSMTWIALCLMGAYIFTYDYESIFRKQEKEPMGRPLIREKTHSMFFVNLLTLLLSSRLAYMHQVYCLLIANFT